MPTSHPGGRAFQAAAIAIRSGPEVEEGLTSWRKSEEAS